MLNLRTQVRKPPPDYRRLDSIYWCSHVRSIQLWHRKFSISFSVTKIGLLRQWIHLRPAESVYQLLVKQTLHTLGSPILCLRTWVRKRQTRHPLLVNCIQILSGSISLVCYLSLFLITLEVPIENRAKCFVNLKYLQQATLELKTSKQISVGNILPVEWAR